MARRRGQQPAGGEADRASAEAAAEEEATRLAQAERAQEEEAREVERAAMAARAHETAEAVEVPDDYNCPITSEIMTDPMVTVGGRPLCTLPFVPAPHT